MHELRWVRNCKKVEFEAKVELKSSAESEQARSGKEEEVFTEVII